MFVCRPPEGGVAAGRRASDSGGDVGGGGAERCSGSTTGGTETPGATGRPGSRACHDNSRTGTQLDLKLNWFAGTLLDLIHSEMMSKTPNPTLLGTIQLQCDTRTMLLTGVDGAFGPDGT